MPRAGDEPGQALPHKPYRLEEMPLVTLAPLDKPVSNASSMSGMRKAPAWNRTRQESRGRPRQLLAQPG